MYKIMPQVTKLVDKLIPKIECEDLLDVGIGDGETIKTILPFFKIKKLYGCDPSCKPENTIIAEQAKYEDSNYFNQSFDLITFFDSLACYYKKDGEEILDHAIEQAKKMVIVWTPDGYYPYPPFQSCWHAEDFLNRGFSVYKAKDIHQGPPTIGSGLLTWLIK
jgi:hypothetical protein